jgi:hypothetical protein
LSPFSRRANERREGGGLSFNDNKKNLMATSSNHLDIHYKSLEPETIQRLPILFTGALGQT